MCSSTYMVRRVRRMPPVPPPHAARRRRAAVAAVPVTAQNAQVNTKKYKESKRTG